MPGRGTPHAAIRIDPALWLRFDEAAKANGTDRSALLREWITAYVESDARPPRRPTNR
jgi:predicted transcriptional regulator